MNLLQIKRQIKVKKNNFTKDSNSIHYDSFLGSGSTLIACEQTNRVCYGMEISPAYIDVIIQRWENFTGQQAVKKIAWFRIINTCRGVGESHCKHRILHTQVEERHKIE